jgi:hypothetical protein
MHSNHKRPPSTVIWAVAILTAGMLMVAATAVGQSSQADNPDWPLRSFAIHWPTGMHRQMLIFSRTMNC